MASIQLIKVAIIFLIYQLCVVYAFNNNLSGLGYVRTKTGKTRSELNLFWSKGEDKKKQKDESSKSSQSTKQTSKMGTTATTMENFKQSQELGKKTSSLIQELTSIQVEGVAAKGKIKVLVDGQQQPIGVEIDEEYFKEGSSEEFSEALLIAMQDAHKKSQDVMQEKMQSLYGALGLPQSK